MSREEIFAYAEREYGAQPDYPWHDENAVLRHPGGKWFAVVMRISGAKIGLADAGMVDIVNVKCDPILIGSLRTQNGYHPAYHMNKERWLTIRLDGSVPMEEIAALLSMSYNLTSPAKGRK